MVDSVEFFGDKAQAEVFSDQTSLQGFPVSGSTYGIISSGVAEQAPGNPDGFLSTFFSSSPGYIPESPDGFGVNDPATLRLSFTVPSGMETLSFSFRFATEEIPVYTDSIFQDFFVAELVRPDGSSQNVARLPDGSPVTVQNSNGFSSKPDDLSFNRVTSEITAEFDVSGSSSEQFDLYLSVADASDSALDSATFIDGLGVAGVNLTDPIADKRNRISSIRDSASTIIGDQSAEDRVDLAAEGLVDDIDEDRLGASPGQYRCALARMNSSESVTQVATDTVTGPDNPVDKTSENLYSFVTGAAIELLPEVGERAVGKILKRVPASILDDVTGLLDDAVQTVRGSGALPTSSLNDIDDNLNAYKISQSTRTSSAIRNNPDVAREAVKGAAGGTLKGGKLLAEATNPDAKENLLETVESILFETYYFFGDLPVVDIPNPDNVTIPSFDINYDLPDEELPDILEGAVPDKIRISSGEVNIDISEVPALGDVSRLLDEFNEVNDDIVEGGIDNTIDSRMEYIRNNIESIEMQDPQKRENVENVATNAIQAVETLLNDILIDGFEKISEVLALGSKLASAGLIAALAGAAFLALTGFGAATALGLAGTLATVATALSIATLIIDVIQIASGFSFAIYDATVHQFGTYFLAERSLEKINL